MNSHRRYLEEQLQNRELETSELRRNLHELRTKFVHLERAFEINLQLQLQREVELNHVKQESQDLRKLNDQTMWEEAEVMNVVNEKDHWKNAFLRQGEFIKRNKMDCENTVNSVKRECEGILRMARETTDKRFQELIDIHNNARAEVERLEEEATMHRAREKEHKNRTFELANLLETLKRFDVNVNSVFQLVAEALKNLTDRGNLFDESLKNLRHLTWTAKDRKPDAELVLLRKQNFVLREVVKNLKRTTRLQQTENAIPERENEQRKDGPSLGAKMSPWNTNRNTPRRPTVNANFARGDPIETIDTIAAANYFDRDNKGETRDTRETVNGYDNIENFKKCDNDTNKISNDDKSAKVLSIRTHLNGVMYEEYILKLSMDREMKIKYPLSANDNSMPIKMEFVDHENEYDRESLDKMIIFLKNIHACVNIKQTGVPCSIQTSKIKTSSKFTQTPFSGINTISRLNAGVTMLNSEKRAIERSLCNLERTVAALTFKALGQAARQEP